MSPTITTGPRKSVLKGKRGKMYNIVKNNIGAAWFWNMIRNKRRGNNYALHNNSGKLAGFAVMGKNLPHLGGSTYLFLIGARPGHGYGSQLLARVIQDAKARGLHYIFLEPTEERVKVWYRRFGFTNVSNDLMVLNLNSK
jgi:N-acetylglutamate synthase-like GNAT family acetyltransferase